MTKTTSNEGNGGAPEPADFDDDRRGEEALCDACGLSTKIRGLTNYRPHERASWSKLCQPCYRSQLWEEHKTRRCFNCGAPAEGFARFGNDWWCRDCAGPDLGLPEPIDTEEDREMISAYLDADQLFTRVGKIRALRRTLYESSAKEPAADSVVRELIALELGRIGDLMRDDMRYRLFRNERVGEAGDPRRVMQARYGWRER